MAAGLPVSSKVKKAQPFAPGILRETAANDAAGSPPDLRGPRDARRSGSIGLSNVRNRLRGLYGAEATLEVANVEGCGVRVTIRQPWRESAEAEVVLQGGQRLPTSRKHRAALQQRLGLRSL
jgi:hypothetical protein